MRMRFAFGLILLAAGTARAQSGPYTGSQLPPTTASADAANAQAATFIYNPTAPTGPTLTPGPTPVASPAPTPVPAVADETTQRTSSGSSISQSLAASYNGSYDPGDDGYQGKWYAVAYALGMTRNRATAFWTTNTANDFFDFKMNTQSAGADWTGGGQVTVGYAWRGCEGPSVAFTYWGLAPMNGFATVSDTTGNSATALSSTINFSAVTINGNPGSLYFDNAQEQSLWRRDRADNLEFNLQSGTYTVGSLQLAALAGFRYFRFTDKLLYGSASFGNSFTSNNGNDAAYLRHNCNNNLFGGQVGATITSIMTERFTVFATPKVGIMGNQMNDLQEIFSGNPSAPLVSQFRSNKNDVSVLAELDAGFTLALTPNCRFIAGYRVVAISNLALADNQFGAYNHVAQNGDLILHGAFMGLGWLL